VLFADDGSAGAAPARDFALMVAAAAHARLTVLYVREPIETDTDARGKLAATCAAAAAAGLTCRTIVQRPVGITNAGRRILESARRGRADAIVLGAKGAGLTRKLLGSVSSYVASRAPVSVCVIR
jgi:nucleotide-binding universal stress UspA family protein